MLGRRDLRSLKAGAGLRPGGRLTREQVFAVLSPLMLLISWEALVRLGPLDQRIFSSPTAVTALAWQLLIGGQLAHDMLITLGRLGTGMIVGTVPGTLLGLTMGLFRTPRAIGAPLVSVIYPLPRVALFPLVLLVVGLNETSNTIMVALGPFFTMLITAMVGVTNVEPIYLKVARSFNIRKRDLYLRVVFPAALPIILSGLRLSLGLAMLGVVAVEFLTANNGLGYMIWHSWQIISPSHSMVGLVMTGLIGYVLFLVLDLLELRALPWTEPRRA